MKKNAHFSTRISLKTDVYPDERDSDKSFEKMKHNITASSRL